MIGEEGGEGTAADRPDTGAGADGPAPPADDVAGGRWRLRDLGPRGRWAAVVLGLGLLLIPLVGLAANHGRWVPQGDDALIELRARDVGTDRTPLVGQPSTSGAYGQGGDAVAHPGPLGFVVLAPGLRAFGPITGVLGTTALLSGACLVVVAWVLFRHAGPRAGAAGAILGALAAASAGASGLLDPLSSNAGRLPLLAAAVAVWALLVGDLRLAPLAVGLTSFAAQQHLSVLPAAAVLAGVGGVAIVVHLGRSAPGSRRGLGPWVGGGVATGLVLWAPVLWQQATGSPGNLSALAGYSGDGQRRDLGVRSAVGQVAQVLGPRPLLGRSGPRGWDLVAHRSTPGVLLTLAVVAVALGVGAWWARREPGLVAAVAMVGVLAVAGVVTGTNVPDSPEQGRLNLFHWAFALSFFELLVVAWLLARLAPKVTPQLTHGRAATAVVLAGVVVAGVAIVPTVVDRRSDRLAQPLPTDVVVELERAVRRSPAGDGDADGPLVVLVNGDDRYIQVGDTVGVDLIAHGVDVRFPRANEGFVHPDRLSDGCGVDRFLVLTLVLPGVAAPPGVEVARVDAAPDLDHAALDRLTRAASGVHVELGDDLAAHLAGLPGAQGRLIASVLALRLPNGTGNPFLSRSNLDLLVDHPLDAPVLVPDDLRALRRSFPDGADSIVATEVTAHLLHRADVAAWRPDLLTRC